VKYLGGIWNVSWWQTKCVLTQNLQVLLEFFEKYHICLQAKLWIFLSTTN
jgi:hypothetical protein